MACRQFKGYHTAENIITHFEQTVINFEFTNKRLSSTAGRVFMPDRYCLTDKRFELLMLINCNKDFKC